MTAQTDGTERVSRRSRMLVFALFVLWTGGSLAALCAQRDLWPFSPYRMYARRVTRAEYEQLEVAGATAEGPPAERLLLDDDELAPFDRQRLTAVLRRIARRRDADTALAAGLRDIAARYETLRRAGRHGGPALAEVRLYVTTWNVEGGGARTDVPVSRILRATSGARAPEAR